MTSSAVERWVDEVDQRLRELGSPERAAHEKAYLKSDLTLYGVGVPPQRALVREFHKSHPSLALDDLRARVLALWARPVHELRLTGVLLLERYAGSLEESDMALVEDLVRRSRTWALVDGLAVKVAGSLVRRFPACRSQVDRWARDDDFWLRRSALLALLDEVRLGGDFEAFARLAVPMLGEREFFIRKAIGWVLRETSKRQPEVVRAFIGAHRGEMAGLTLREASKYLE